MVTDASQPPAFSSRDLLLTLLGNHWQGQQPTVEGGRDLAVASSTFVDVLGRVGISEQAVRATLNRAVKQGLLARHQRGRQAYFGLTASTRRVLAAGAARLYHTDPVLTDWDGTWTLLSFSIPESRRPDRHRLRVRLAWLGFGPLRDGVWLAPGAVDVEPVVDELGLADDIDVFVGHAARPTDVDRRVAQTWDLDVIAAAYGHFLERWDRDVPLSGAPDDLARSLWLVTEWRLLLLDDPVLPPAHLPADWPAPRAREVFDRCFAHYRATAVPLFEQVCDALDDPAPAHP